MDALHTSREGNVHAVVNHQGNIVPPGDLMQLFGRSDLVPRVALLLSILHKGHTYMPSISRWSMDESMDDVWKETNLL